MKRLSEGHQKVVRGDLFNRFSLMTNFLPESCQNKMTRGCQDTKRLSQGRHRGRHLLKACQKVVKRLSKGCQKVVIRLS